MIGFKIKYEVKNWSEIQPVSMMWEIVKTRTTGAYFLYDKNKEIIYIGKSTTCIRQRLNNHLFQDITGGTSYMNKYELELALERRSDTMFFSYISTEKVYAEILEIALITKFKPKYNRKICA